MEDHPQKKPISLRTINIAMIVIAIAAVTIVMFLVLHVQERYKQMHRSTQIYNTCELAAPNLNKGSDYLTEQVRCFAVTGEKHYCDQYFYEAKVLKTRDKAINTLKPYMEGTQAMNYLEDAMKNSVELMDMEYYSMALMWEAMEFPRNNIPEEIASVSLSAEDAALSKEEKHQKAIQMVFDSIYQSYKTTISYDVDLCVSELMNTMKTELEESYDEFNRMLTFQLIMIIVLLCVVLGVIIITLRLVMRPMMRAAEYIRDNQTLPVRGASELQLLASAYNDVFEKSKKRQEYLREKALHDSLTGLFNRTGYDTLIEQLEENSFCLILIDVDKFKRINDQHGHDVGDEVLKKVAAVLHDQFRAEDLIFRFGGDEFAVIMRKTGEHLTALVRSKIEAANKMLSEAEDLPQTSLSAGAVFGSGTVTDSLFKKADTALYKTKNEGGCGITFSKPSKKHKKKTDSNSK